MECLFWTTLVYAQIDTSAGKEGASVLHPPPSASPAWGVLDMLYKVRVLRGLLLKCARSQKEESFCLVLLILLFWFTATIRQAKDSCVLGDYASAAAGENVVCRCVSSRVITQFSLNVASLAEEPCRTQLPFPYEVVQARFLQLSRQRLSVRGN